MDDASGKHSENTAPFDSSSSGNGRLHARLGVPTRLLASTTIDRIELSRNGELLVVLDEGAVGDPRIVRTATASTPAVFLIPGETSRCAVSPDGHWVAISYHHSPVTIWDGRSCKRLKTLPDKTPYAALTFSPDGRWLVTGTEDEYRFWNTGGGSHAWQPLAAGPCFRASARWFPAKATKT